MRSSLRLGAALAFALVLGPVSLFAQPSLLPKSGEVGEWTLTAAPERYVKESLYGYINGGAELYLPYGFENLEVGHFSRTPGTPSREIAVEIYRMASPLGAFGIFSVQREGDEQSAAALPNPNWTLPGQAAFVKGSYFVTVQGVPADDEGVRAMAMAIARRIEPGRDIFSDSFLNVLPAEGRKSGSERYIKGEPAARNETQFFSLPYWGFAEETTAVSARYGSDGIKLLIVDLPTQPPSLDSSVREQFESNLEGTRISEGTISARNSAGHWFLFARRGRRAFFVFGKTNEAEALEVLRRAFGDSTSEDGAARPAD
uniref:Uncharacterized protein n=1 Tax=uncultured Aminicenantes bacterium TaxID=174294 RepID=Q2Z002_9BACT|nr:hypothetical protein [uncultured Aminicenantes bacterium]